VVVRPLGHVAPGAAVGPAADEGQAAAGPPQVHAPLVPVVAGVERALGAATVDQLQPAVAGAPRPRRGHRLAQLVPRRERLGAVLQRLGADPVGQLLDPDGEAAGAGTVLFGEARGIGVRILVEQEGAVALPVGADRTATVAGDLGEAQLAEVVVELAGLASGGGELDELEAVDAHGVLESGDRHARSGAGSGRKDLRLHAHDGFLIAPRRGTGSWDRPFIVTCATTCKVPCRNDCYCQPRRIRVR